VTQTTGDVAGLVLAAGAGSRFGRPKALIEVGREVLVDRAVRTLRDGGCAPVIVVLGAGADEVRRTARLDGVVVDNADWKTGMASSLRCGLTALADTQAGAAVIALVDQPGMSAEAVERLIERWRGGAVAVVASYHGKQRHPVLLDARVWEALAASATGDVGARTWLRAHPDDVVHVACDDVADAGDIDVPADLERFLQTHAVEDSA
jgi:CTP:molybdopterin cytidylyltransferase MocA